MKVAEALKPHLRPIVDLVALPDNPRQGDIGAISQSLERFGQLKPIVVDDDDVILAGNHTYRAALALGWSQIAAVTAAELEGSEKTAFALADNRLSDLASYDTAMLLEQLAALDNLDGTGYEYDDLDDLAALSQEHLDPNRAVRDVRTWDERADRREAERAAGMEVRSLVFVLTGPQHAWAIRILGEQEDTDTNTDAFLSILADYSGEEAPE